MKKQIGYKILTGVELISTIIFLKDLYTVDFLSTWMLWVIAIILVGISAFLVLAVVKNWIHWAFLTVAAILSILLIAGTLYMDKAYQTLKKITSQDYQVVKMVVVTMADNPADSIKDVVNDTFGILSVNDRKNTDHSIDKIEKDYHVSLNTREYSDVETLVGSLYNDEVKVILFYDANRSMIKELYTDFDSRTKELGFIEKKTKLKTTKAAKNIVDETFNVYISGIDTKGKVSETSRSDVNIIATVNPKKKEILLVSTPRDFFVPLPNSGGVKDKLTHAGIYGVDCSIGTLENLYDVDINYYLRVNFTGFEKLVNALGEVTVHSDYTFHSDWGPSFVIGDNRVNGKQALAFVRQRHETFRGRKTGLIGGDIQRGRDQQYLIEAIIDKATSPSILKNFSDVMDSLKSSIETNMKASEITDLVKMQLSDMKDWHITMINATGSGDHAVTFSMPSKRLDVMIPNEASVEAAKEMIDKVKAGKSVSESDFKKLMEEKKTTGQ